MTKKLLDIIKKAPETFGVYSFIDSSGRIIYIGKARNLKNRLNSYLSDNLSYRMMTAVSKAEDIKWLICNSEAEALLVEASQIRSLQPKYNILLKDDKSFPEIALSNGDFPSIFYHKGKRSKQNKYFGPFLDSKSVKEVIDLVRKVSRIRNCSDNEFKKRSRPCIEYQIKRCTAPCVNYVTKEEYQTQIQEVEMILSGKSLNLKNSLIEQMENFASSMNYEKAAEIRDKIKALSRTEGIRNRIELSGDNDIIALLKEGEVCVIQSISIRNGFFQNYQTILPSNIDDKSDSQIMADFVAQTYSEQVPPKNIIVNLDPSDKEAIIGAIKIKYGVVVQMINPKLGTKKDAIDMLVKSASDHLDRIISNSAHIKRNLQKLKDFFALGKVPKRIEVFDNSHLFGTNSTGAMIVFGDSGFQKREYKKYNFTQNFTPGNDYAMMEEMLTRRLLKIKEANNDPDLKDKIPDFWIIDGGIGHLGVVKKVMEKVGLFIDHVCIAKGEDRNAGNEDIILPTGEIIKLNKNDDLLYFLQNLRDEAHRFAITTHRKKRGKESISSFLDQIPGLGMARKKILLNHFGSVEIIKGAQESTIASVPGIGKKMAKTIFEFLGH